MYYSFDYAGINIGGNPILSKRKMFFFLYIWSLISKKMSFKILLEQNVFVETLEYFLNPSLKLFCIPQKVQAHSWQFFWDHFKVY